jgi:serine O-acetyltransferase
MLLEIPRERLMELVLKQLNNFFLDVDCAEIEGNMDQALSRLEFSMKHSKNKYFWVENEVRFSPYHSVQYTIFLYYLANTIYKNQGSTGICSKLYYLNKIMNNVDWYFEIELPDIFSAEHPLSCVLGRAAYSNRLFVYQGVTVGGNNGAYPVIGENVILYSNATVLGRTTIGDNVVISSGTYIKDETIPPCSMVFGASPNLTVKVKTLDYVRKYTQNIWRY